jgi:metallopeptidase family M12-like protein/Calx-beta domain-containing protein
MERKRQSNRSIVLLMALTLAWPVGAATPQVPALNADLIRPATLSEIEGQGIPQLDRTVLRRRVAAVEADVLEAIVGGERRSARLRLFDDAVCKVEFDGRTRRSARSATLRGTLAGEPGSSVIMSREGDAVVAVIRSPRRGLYDIRSSDGRLLEIRQIDERALSLCGADDAIPVSLPPLPNTQSAATVRAQVGVEVIDILVAYTPALRANAGGTDATLAQIWMAIDEANAAFAESGADVRLRLVHAVEVNYTESGDFITDLTRLRVLTDGYMDEVGALRDAHGADLVSLVVYSGNSCGVAYMLPSLSPLFAPYGFSVVRGDCAVSNLTFAHEVGHNFGCAHDHDNATSSIFDYAYGHRFTGDSGAQWRSIMSYFPGIRVPRFSNPDVLYDGAATGVAGAGEDAANNAMTLNMSASTVAAFRATVIGFTGTVQIDAEVAAEGQALTASVQDPDLGAESTLDVTVTTDQGDSETITLDATLPGGTQFSGTFTFVGGTPHSGDGIIQAAHGDQVVVTYHDEITQSGGAADISDFVYADLEPPVFAGIASAEAGDGEVSLAWEAATDDLVTITYSIHRATASGAQDFGAPIATTSNLSLTDTGRTNGETLWYVVRAEDFVGNRDDNTVELSATPVAPLDHFEWSAISSPQRLAVPFPVILTARGADGSVATGLTGSAEITATTASGDVIADTVQPSSTGNFVDGVWSGDITVTEALDGLSLRVADGAGHEGMSGVFDVVAPSLNIGDATVQEGDRGETLAVITVTLSESPALEATVDWSTADGDALAGEDYIAAVGTLAFPPGTASLPISVEVIGDLLDESQETFTVLLSGPSNATLGDPEGSVAIGDDDEPETAILAHLLGTAMLTSAEWSASDQNDDTVIDAADLVRSLTPQP